jgi:hypothetical protein
MPCLARLLIAFLIATITPVATARPPLSQAEKVALALDAHAGDELHLYKMTFWLPPRPADAFFRQYVQDPHVGRLGKGRLDLLPFYERLGIPPHPGASAIFDRMTGTLTCVNTGSSLKLITCIPDDGPLPDTYEDVEPSHTPAR